MDVMADRSERPSGPPSQPKRDQGWPRWGIWLVMGMVAMALLLPGLIPSNDADPVAYDLFLNRVAAGEVADVRDIVQRRE